METVVSKAIARSPADRYGTAAELAAELRRVEAGKPIRARRVPLPEQYWRWCNRNPTVAALTALAAVLTLVVAVVSTTAAIWLRRSNAAVGEHLERVQVAERERSEQLWTANLAQARAWRSSRKSGQRFAALSSLERAARLGRELGYPPIRFEEIRDEVIAALALPDIDLAEAIDFANPDEIADVDLASGRFCVRDRLGHASLRRLADGSLSMPLPDAPAPRTLAFGPRNYLADLDGSGRFRVWDLAGPEPKPIVIEAQEVHAWDFAPDGNRLVVTRETSELAFYELPRGRRASVLSPGGARREVKARIHPSAPYVAVTSYFGGQSFEIRHTSSGRTIAVPLPWSQGACFGACWSDDGGTLAISQGEGGQIAIFDFDVKTLRVRLVRTITDSILDPCMFLAFNASGDRLFGGQGWSGTMIMCDPNGGRALFRASTFRRSIYSPFRHDRWGGRLLPGAIDERTSKFRVWSFAEGRECQVLKSSKPGSPGQIAVSADSRLAVVPNSNGWFTAFDLASGREVGQVQVPGGGPSAFSVFDGAGRLITNGFSGCYRWQVRHDPEEAGRLMIGPAERLPFHPGNVTIAASRDGKTVVQGMSNNYGMQPYRGAWIFREEEPGAARRLGPEIGSPFASVSPDGRWAAFGFDTGSRVFDARTGREVWAVPGDQTRCVFSPRSDWVAVGTQATQLFAVGTWEPGPKLGPGSPAAFSSDGRVILIVLPNRLLSLVDVSTGRTLARFEDPEISDVAETHASFTPDDSHLIMPHKLGLRMWDLRRIRAELAARGLDWDSPPLPPAAVTNVPLRVGFAGVIWIDSRFRSLAEFISGLVVPYVRNGPDARDHLAHARSLIRLGLRALARRHLDRALGLEAGLADALVERGQLKAQNGDWEAAAADYTRAISTGPPSAELLLRRAWAHHEAGRIQEAACDLAKAIPLAVNDVPMDVALRVLHAHVLEAAGEDDRALDELALAKARTYDLAQELNSQAWLMLMDRPESLIPSAILVLARKAVALEPENRYYRNTLGLACYRSGRFAEARDVLKAAVAAGPWRLDCFDWLFVAMAHQRLGETSEAASRVRSARGAASRLAART